ncbi:hypothetical protein SPF06_12450 [Sinomonas sp. JGH33]|uniref:Uncharacterized protein n=1 Tax=Sinomonas terricola TaxID=3110330 RepID=A0ABU5T762_9MICC|nr:hypothetical protein [Sinomonas sp. JGH33]MEA5455536.1 hypothetical protein [Sinomonas sp. JGH33]
MSSRFAQTSPDSIVDEPNAAQSPQGGHPPSSPDSESPEEVTTMIQRLRRVLSVGIDAERIEAHREAVHREIALTMPLR